MTEENKEFAVRFMLDPSFDRSRVVEIMDELGIEYRNATKKLLFVYGLYGDLHLEMASRIKEVGFTPQVM